MRLLHIAARKPEPEVWIEPFRNALGELGELTLMDDGDRLDDARTAEIIRTCDVLLTAWGARAVPEELAGDCGQLKYICHITGTMRGYVPPALIEASIPVTNWGDAPAQSVAEGAMALLLAVMKDLHHQIMRSREELTPEVPAPVSGGLEGTDVGVYGLGAIGLRFLAMLRPFGAIVRAYDPYVKDVPEDCIRVDSLEELFSRSEVVVIHAGLTDETRHSVTSELLAMLPDHGILINTARGEIVDNEALFAELRAGRLRAGLDLTEPDPLPAGHPARRFLNCILTPHCISVTRTADSGRPPRMDRMHLNCLDNLRRFARGEPLRFVVDRDRYARST
jgi:phosphoglycerate dehydrogenase-like enzyme